MVRQMYIRPAKMPSVAQRQARPGGHFGGTAGVERRADSVRRLEVFKGRFLP